MEDLHAIIADTNLGSIATLQLITSKQSDSFANFVMQMQKKVLQSAFKRKNHAVRFWIKGLNPFEKNEVCDELMGTDFLTVRQIDNAVTQGTGGVRPPSIGVIEYQSMELAWKYLLS
jgi:hypothetical protein